VPLKSKAGTMVAYEAFFGEEVHSVQSEASDSSQLYLLQNLTS